MTGGRPAVLVLVGKPDVTTPKMEADVHREVFAVAVDHVAVLSLCAVLGVRTEELSEQVGTLEGMLLYNELPSVSVGDLHSVCSDS